MHLYSELLAVTQREPWETPRLVSVRMNIASENKYSSGYIKHQIWIVSNCTPEGNSDATETTQKV